MKISMIFFALKCTVIICFSLFAGVDYYTNSTSATPQITKGIWQVNLFTDGRQDKTPNFGDYTIKFEPDGKLTASKNGVAMNGYWVEDDIQQTISISINTNLPAFKVLNSSWQITDIDKTGINLKTTNSDSENRLFITALYP